MSGKDPLLNSLMLVSPNDPNAIDPWDEQAQRREDDSKSSVVTNLQPEQKDASKLSYSMDLKANIANSRKANANKGMIATAFVEKNDVLPQCRDAMLTYSIRKEKDCLTYAPPPARMNRDGKNGDNSERECGSSLCDDSKRLEGKTGHSDPSKSLQSNKRKIMLDSSENEKAVKPSEQLSVEKPKIMKYPKLFEKKEGKTKVCQICKKTKGLEQYSKSQQRKSRAKCLDCVHVIVAMPDMAPKKLAVAPTDATRQNAGKQKL